MNSENYLANLIKERIALLGFKEHELVKRLGYKNLGKGLNRLQKLYNGEFDGADHILNHLPQGLEIEKTYLDEAYQRTVELAEALKIREAELSFKPHAVYLTQHRVPVQIVIAGIIGADRMRFVYFDPSDDPESFKDIALVKRPDKIPTFGAVTGLIVNYSPHYAIEYDLEGKRIRVLKRQKIPGHVELKCV